VGRCTLTPPDPQLPIATQAVSTLAPYQVKTRFQNVPFKCNVHRYIVARQGPAAKSGVSPGLRLWLVCALRVGLRTVN
jgi:hypothetical protein